VQALRAEDIPYTKESLLFLWIWRVCKDPEVQLADKEGNIRQKIAMKGKLHGLASALLALPAGYYVTARTLAEFSYAYFTFFTIAAWLGIWFISLWAIVAVQSYLFLSKPYPKAEYIAEKIQRYEQECIEKAKKQRKRK